MAKNLELLDRVMDFIHMNPERWNQGTWFGGGDDLRDVATLTDITDPDNIQGENWCGTTGCIAGHTLAMCGYRPVVIVDESGLGYINEASVVKVGEPFITYESYDEEDRPFLASTSVSLKAAELLGLDWYEANLLFKGYNSMEAIEHLVKAWHNGVDTSKWADAWGPDHPFGQNYNPETSDDV